MALNQDIQNMSGQTFVDHSSDVADTTNIGTFKYRPQTNATVTDFGEIGLWSRLPIRRPTASGRPVPQFMPYPPPPPSPPAMKIQQLSAQAGSRIHGPVLVHRPSSRINRLAEPLHRKRLPSIRLTTAQRGINYNYGN